MSHVAAVQRLETPAKPLAADARREPYTRAQLLNAASQLGKLDCAPLELPNLAAEITKNLVRGTGAQVALTSLDGMALDTVATVMQQLQNSSSTTAPVKALVRALQLPLLKIACIDPAMAVTRDHPAWHLLELIFEASVGWQTRDDLVDDGVFATVTSAVKSLVHAHGDDLSVVLAAIATIEASLTTQQRQQKDHLQRISAARSAVHEALAGTLATISAPACVTEFLRGPWRRVLCHIAERDGANSEAWKIGADVVEQLLWSISPKSDDAARKLFVTMVPTLLASIEEGMALIQFPHAEKNTFFVELEKLHLRALRGSGIQLHGPSAASRAVFERFGTTISVEEVTLETNHDGSMHSAQPQERVKTAAVCPLEQMKIGTWIEWRNHDAPPWRGQLAWTDGFFREVTFVNRRGNVAADIGYDTFIAALRSGQARVVDGGAIIRRVLGTKID